MHKIANYNEKYKPTNTSGGELVNAYYVKMPVKPRGKGLRALLKKQKGLEIFGIWCLLLQAATETTNPKMRGMLLNYKDEPASVEEIAESISLDRHVSKVKKALDILVDLKWLEYVPCTDEVQNGSVQEPEQVPSKISKGKKSKDKISILCDVFDKARKKYPDSKRGLKTEFDNFTKKHKDWQQVVHLLEPAIDDQIEERAAKKVKNEFVPNWKHFSVWINNRWWEAETSAPKPKIRTCCIEGCDKPKTLTVVNDDFCSVEHRALKLGW